MSEKAIRETTRGSDGVAITMFGKTTVRSDFDPKLFARAIKRSRRRINGMSIAERQAWTEAAEAKLAQG